MHGKTYIKGGTENKGIKKKIVKKITIKEISLARLGKGSCFQVGVKGSNLHFNKRKVASSDRHCNVGKILSVQFNTYSYHICLPL